MYEVADTPFSVISAAAQRAREANSSDFPARISQLAIDLEMELARPAALQQIADALLPFAKECGCTSIVGASPVGERIAGALMARHGMALLSRREAPASRVLVLDAVLTTGAQMQQAIERVRNLGQLDVCGAVLVADHEALRTCSAFVGARIVALAHAFEPLGHPLRIAMRAAWAHFVAARDGVPRRLGPLDGRFVGHYIAPWFRYLSKICFTMSAPVLFGEAKYK